nr:tRNA threonylcarbamoyladenosine dehydratase [Oscillospiraceae bacterium]
MNEQNSRTEMLLGIEGVERLSAAKVAVFGVGGVGGYATEALARAGMGEIHLIDSDKVSISNINRQIIATHDTVGRYKTEAMRDRILSINPDCKVVCYNLFFDESTKDEIDFKTFDYVIDAIDSLSAKVELIAFAHAAQTKIISAMGAGNKLDPTLFEVSDISKTTVCPLARAVRIALRKKGINHLKVVYSKEPPAVPPEVSDGVKKRVPGSLSFVPSVMGLILAGEVIKDIAAK